MADMNIKDNISEKDIKDKKTEKLTSAVYLVTNFLSDNDPIKWKLRERSLDIWISFLRDNFNLSHIDELLSLIDVAVFDRHASPMNFSFLRQEYLSLKNWLRDQPTDLLPALPSLSSLPNPASPSANTSFSPKIKPKTHTYKNKNDRRSVILEHLKAGAWLSIKDIAKNLPSFSSKTVQRELNSLASAGLIQKTGERRWSRYTRA